MATGQKYARASVHSSWFGASFQRSYNIRAFPGQHLRDELTANPKPQITPKSDRNIVGYVLSSASD